MSHLKLTLGLAAGAAVSALLAPRLLPWLSGAPDVAPLPIAARLPAEVATPAAAEPGSVTVRARLDHGAAPRGVPTERYLVIEVAGPDAVPGGARSPVDVAVVIDASGSMSQERKIDYARKGAAFLLSELSPTDGFSLVTFSDRANVLYPLAPVGDRLRAERAIRGVVEGGGTNLGDGIDAAIREIRRAPAGDVRRVVLLSDGQANIGEVDPGALARLAGSLASEGVTVSAIGLGLDYNENLLAGISDLGGGTYDFVDTPGELQAALHDELERSQAQVARTASLHVALPPGVALLEVIGWPTTRTDDGFDVFVGDVYAGGERRIVTRVLVTGTGDEAPVATATVRYHDLGLGREAVAAASVTSRVTADREVVAGSADGDVGALASRATGNWYAEQSARAHKEGRRDAADQLVRQARDVLSVASRRYDRPELEADLRAIDHTQSVLETAPASSPEAQRAVKRTQEGARGLYK